jgi:hypothetical protein
MRDHLVPNVFESAAEKLASIVARDLVASK